MEAKWPTLRCVDLRHRGEASTLSQPAEDLEREFLEAPTPEGLLTLYRALLEQAEDHHLAEVLDKIRPIQHRITLVQADVEPELLEALTRDPHAHVRRVVAAHARITEEVAFRLCEDAQADVRLALRKNPVCPVFIATALAVREKKSSRDKALAGAEHYLEAAWQARRADLNMQELVELTEEWCGVGAEQLESLTLEQASLLLQVLEGKLGIGPMPKKGRGSKRAATSSKRVAKKKTKARHRSK